MQFNILEFARTNRVILIWAAFFTLIYMMREMFGLFFLTFVMCFITHGITSKLHRLTKQKRKFLVIMLYIIFLLGIVSFLIYGLPKIYGEATRFTAQLPQTLNNVEGLLDDITQDNPNLAQPIERIKDALTFEKVINKAASLALVGLEQAWHYVTWFFISMLFSFLIMLDLPELMKKFVSLKRSKLGEIYKETASSVVKFSQVVGENFRAQILISCINTTLTLIGLIFIGTGTTALLSFVVFLCGLIPVLGVIISSIPIMLVALNVGGLKMVLAVLVLIVIVHVVEAYILNPRIISAVMRINPVLTLMILYIAHSLMGIWGMLLGVPIAVYCYRHVLQVSPNGVNGKSPPLPPGEIPPDKPSNHQAPSPGSNPPGPNNVQRPKGEGDG
ncbi:MAG: AI-2E family transporter [Deltaproteobacteria bacterium]|jgi:predicted PurR-regulated permease PerM|nr:AI-2E family transporter [Deltaproteobacteria bacterium]